MTLKTRARIKTIHEYTFKHMNTVKLTAHWRNQFHVNIQVARFFNVGESDLEPGGIVE